jgi:hypothetical protein
VRLWSVHPRYLDTPGLTAAWREGLLAQKVLAGQTRGYRQHPQLTRFRAADESAIAAYLDGVWVEAAGRGYAFDRTKIVGRFDPALRLEVTNGQLAHEWAHLRAKLAERSPTVLARWRDVPVPEPHPLFVVVAGPVAPWEVIRPGG